MWLCAVIVSHHVHGTVVTIHNEGDNSTSCCTDGNCACSSLYNALLSIKNNTVVNITSLSVSLNNCVYFGSGNIKNITIISNSGATVMCNNTGTIHCYKCSNVTIKGIMWDQCGNPNYPLTAGIVFSVVSNLSIINCTFQEFKICTCVKISRPTGIINIMNSKFMFNMISDSTLCKGNIYSSLLIYAQHSTCGGRLTLIISDSLFYHNGNSIQNDVVTISGSLLVYLACLDVQQPFVVAAAYLNLSILVKNSNFTSNDITGVFIYDTSLLSTISLENVNIFDNSEGMLVKSVKSVNGSQILLTVDSSLFSFNRKGALNLNLTKGEVNRVELYNSIFTKNNGISDVHGTALSITYYALNSGICNISFCNFINNAGGNSIVYISVSVPIFIFPTVYSRVFISSSNFTGNKIGSALHITKSFLKFYSTTLFQDNSARSGAAIYIAQTSQITVDDGSTVQLVNNTASLRGGAMYIDLSNNCYNRGIVFTNFTRYDAISFINNSAKLSGNSLYFNIDKSCDVIRNYTSNGSTAYVPYKFNYTQLHDIIGPAIAATPYEINLCPSTKCALINNTNSSTRCIINNNIMLGQPVYFNATLCDYFYTAVEAVYFQVKCINCGSKYRFLDNKILIQNGLENHISILSVNADGDLENNSNVSLKFLSFSPNYKQLTSTLSLTLSSCYNGFLFSAQSQKCECYNKTDYLHCEGDSASIKLGYWFGVFSGKYALSLCNNNYCNFFSHRKETMNGFYNLPEEIDDQCSSHRTGVACGECSEGYTLAYNSPDCISVDKCSPGMTVLVVVLTALYWVAIVAMLFGITYYLKTKAKVSLGYLYGILYFYSTVDILLVSNLYTTNQVFYTVSTLSSLAKLNPQFLGRLCFIKNLDTIDQQFIHYCHVVFISILLTGIKVTAKSCKRIALHVDHCIVQVVCLFLLLSFSSLISISVPLLRPVEFSNIDGVYTYLSPDLKYFTNQHKAYVGVAMLCTFLITASSLFLLLQPCPWLFVIKKITSKCRCWRLCERFNRKMKKCWLKTKWRIQSFARIGQIVHQFQDSYKDQYRWFAAYYLICRLVIMLITYFANDDYNNMIYYLQTACVVITLIHMLVQPYKNDILNMLDATILLIMLLIVNLNSFTFSTSTTAGITVGLVVAPFLLIFGIKAKKALRRPLSLLLGYTVKKFARHQRRVSW